MWCYSIKILLLFLVTSKNVFSLVCFTSSFNYNELKKIDNISYELQDCSQYINGIRKRLNHSEGEPEQNDLTCFTAIATVPDKFPVYFKGCVPKNHCKELEPILRNKFVQQATVDCYECDEDYCNSSPTSNLVNFSILFLFILLILEIS